jgi:hypothetical protein
VAIDDREVRLIAYSSHEGVAVDLVRQHSILNRRVPADVVRYVHSWALDATGPVRIPPDHSLGFELARVLLPVKHDGVLLGWVVLIDDEGPLDQADLAAAMEAARTASVLFRRDRQAEQLDQSRMRELLPSLLSGNEDEQKKAADALIESELFAAGGMVVVLVATVRPSTEILGDAERTALEGAAEKALRGLPARQHLHLVRLDHAVLVISANDVAAVTGDGAWRNNWDIVFHTAVALLVSLGSAVLNPNGRGSIGRGPAFVESILGALGGKDLADYTTAATAMVERGLADGNRLSVIGHSYGGFTASCLAATSDLFAAAVAISPVTESDAEHVVYPEEGHWVRGWPALLDQSVRVVHWLERYAR